MHQVFVPHESRRKLGLEIAGSAASEDLHSRDSEGHAQTWRGGGGGGGGGDTKQ